MTEIARRTIDELRMRYELEPALQDVYVEGQFDQDVISTCLREHGKCEQTVYSIDSIEVPTGILAEHHLTDGNKQRVLALAQELSPLPPECSFRCLVDKDLDHWFGLPEAIPRLIWTRFSSLELHFFRDDLLQHILVTSAKCKIPDWDAYSSSLIEALRQLYAARLADRELGWSLKWVSSDRCMRVAGSRIELDLVELINRVLLKNGKMANKGQFQTALYAWLPQLTGDCRNHIRGHDFLDLLAWTVQHFHGINSFASPLAIERILVLLSIQVSDIVSSLQ